MSLATISAKIEAQDKLEFETFCNNVGMNVTTAINLYVKAVLREGRIPFEIVTDPFYSDANKARLRASIKELQSGNVVNHDLIED